MTLEIPAVEAYKDLELELVGSDLANDLAKVSKEIEGYVDEGAAVIGQVVASARAYGKPAPTAALAIGVFASGLAASPAMASALGIAAVAGPLAPIVAFAAFFIGQVVGAIIEATKERPPPIDQFLRSWWGPTQSGEKNWPGCVINEAGGQSFAAWLERQIPRCRQMMGIAPASGPLPTGDFSWIMHLMNKGGAPRLRLRSGRFWEIDGRAIDVASIYSQIRSTSESATPSIGGANWQQQGTPPAVHVDLYAVLGCYLVLNDLGLLVELWDRFVRQQLEWIRPDVEKKSDPKWVEYWLLFVRCADARYIDDGSREVYVGGGDRFNGIPARDYPVWVPLPIEAQASGMFTTTAPRLYHPFGQWVAVRAWRDFSATPSRLQTISAIDPRSGVVPLDRAWSEMSLAEAKAVLAAQVVQATVASGYLSQGVNEAMKSANKAQDVLQLCRPGTPSCDAPRLRTPDFHRALQRLLAVVNGATTEQVLLAQSTRRGVELGDVASEVTNARRNTFIGQTLSIVVSALLAAVLVTRR